MVRLVQASQSQVCGFLRAAVCIYSSSNTDVQAQYTLNATAFQYALQPSAHSVTGLDPQVASCLAIDRAAQGETKRSARAWVPVRRTSRKDSRCRRSASHKAEEGRGAWYGVVCRKQPCAECVYVFERRGEREQQWMVWSRASVRVSSAAVSQG